MKIIFFGTPDFAVPTLERLLSHDAFDVLAVVTQPDKPRGRGKKLIPSPVKAAAVTHGLPVWQPKRIKKSREAIAQLQAAAADFFVVVAYGQILSQEILDIPKQACINVHGSLLPEYRGAAPIQWSVCDGRDTTGITTMLMDAGMDTGAMLLKASTPIGLLENADDLSQRLATIGADLLIETLLQLNGGTLTPTPQDDSQATYARLIQKEDYQLDWSQPAIALHNRIRGFFPDCFTQFRDQNLKLTATAPLGAAYWEQLPPEIQRLQTEWDKITGNNAAQPGEVVFIAKKLGAIVQTGEGFLLLREVQLPGKRPQSGWDFVNGTRLAVGERVA